MSERAQALEAALRGIRDSARVVHNTATDHTDAAYAAGMNTAVDRIEKAMKQAREAPAEGVSPTAVVAALRAVINGCLDPHTPMCGDDAELAPFLRRVLRAKDQAVHDLRRRLAALTEPKARELDAALTVLETLQKDGYYLHRADGTLLDDQQEFVAAVVHALDAIAPVEPTGVSPQPNLMICPACLGSGRGCGLCAGTGDVQDMPAPPVSPVEQTPEPPQENWFTRQAKSAADSVAQLPSWLGGPEKVEPDRCEVCGTSVTDVAVTVKGHQFCMYCAGVTADSAPTVEPEPCLWQGDAICPTCHEPVSDSPEADLPSHGSLEVECQTCGAPVEVTARRRVNYRVTPLKIDGRTP